MLSTYICLASINFFIPLRAGIVEELLGGDIMEHNILHKHIGVTETLATLSRFHDLPGGEEEPTDPHWSYFQRKFLRPEASLDNVGDEELEMLAALLGVKKVNREELAVFQASLSKVEPRETEGFGFGKVSNAVREKMD